MVERSRPMSNSLGPERHLHRVVQFYGLLVLLPIVILIKTLDHDYLLLGRYSLWVLIPITGGLVVGLWARSGRLVTSLLALSGFTSFWTAATWSAQSKVTSNLEILLAAGTGIIPGLFIYFMSWEWRGGNSVVEDLEPDVGSSIQEIALEAPPPVIAHSLNHENGGGAGALQHTDSLSCGIAFPQILRCYWKQILFFGGAIIFLSVQTVLDLEALESGSQEHIRMWALLVSFYGKFGYWPTVLFCPLVGLIGGIVCVCPAWA